METTRQLCLEYLEQTDPDSLNLMFASVNANDIADDIAGLLHAAQEIIRRLTAVAVLVKDAPETSRIEHEVRMVLAEILTGNPPPSLTLEIPKNETGVPVPLVIPVSIALGRVAAERLLRLQQSTDVRKIPAIVEVLSEPYPSS